METTDTPQAPLADPRRTWRIPDDRRLPALEPYADDVRRLPSVTVRERLWDTDDRALAFAAIELLQGDDGWSVDRGSGAEPVSASGIDDAAGVDVQRDPVEAVLRGRPVQVVRVRDTTTALVRLHGRDGRVRAEVADVRVDEGDPATTALRSARWWALSDDGDTGNLARSVERALSDAAADGGIGPGDPVPTLAPVKRPVTAAAPRPRPGSAAAFVRDALVPLRDGLLAVDPRVRADGPDAVHDFRKVLRRLRSVLASYRGALDPNVTEPLRGRLRAMAHVAGVARDAEVLQARIPESAARAPAGLVEGEVLRTALAVTGADRTAAMVELRAALRSPAWFEVLDVIDDLVDQAPAGANADRDAAGFTAKRIGRERTRVREAIDRIGDVSDSSAAGLPVLHDARKAARRLRYALEAAGDLPDVGRRRLGRLRRVQEALGDALDAEHAVDAYRALVGRTGAGSGAAPHASSAAPEAVPGATGFGYGVLAATERSIVAERLRDGERALGRLRRTL